MSGRFSMEVHLAPESYTSSPPNLNCCARISVRCKIKARFKVRFRVKNKDRVILVFRVRMRFLLSRE